MSVPLHQIIRNKITEKVINNEIPSVDTWHPLDDEHTATHQREIERLVHVYHETFECLYFNSCKRIVHVQLPSSSLSGDLLQLYYVVARILNCEFMYEEQAYGFYAQFVNNGRIVDTDLYEKLSSTGTLRRFIMPVLL